MATHASDLIDDCDAPRSKKTTHTHDPQAQARFDAWDIIGELRDFAENSGDTEAYDLYFAEAGETLHVINAFYEIAEPLTNRIAHMLVHNDSKSAAVAFECIKNTIDAELKDADTDNRFVNVGVLLAVRKGAITTFNAIPGTSRICDLVIHFIDILVSKTDITLDRIEKPLSESLNSESEDEEEEN